LTRDVTLDWVIDGVRVSLNFFEIAQTFFFHFICVAAGSDINNERGSLRQMTLRQMSLRQKLKIAKNHFFELKLKLPMADHIMEKIFLKT
jgi:hypothetical protein